jgi:hypothetical protein
MNRVEQEDFDKAVSDSQKIIAKYPDYVPVIVRSHQINLKKKKFLVPKDVSVSYLLIAIRKHVENIDPSTAIFIFCNSNIIGSNSMLYEVYEKHVINKKTSNMFLYIDIAKENTFG